MLKFPSIEQFYHVRRNIREFDTHVIQYRHKIKLHGTNASIRITPDGEVFSYSRTQLITPTSDNAGFAKWVESTKRYWQAARQTEDVVIFGEWAGPGIQKGTAVNLIPEKSFFIFMACIGEERIIDPDAIWDLLEDEVVTLENVHIIPWSDVLEINWLDEESVKNASDEINALVQTVETMDPYIYDRYGVYGIGEGLVFYPLNESFSKYAFKAKGEKHKVVKTKKATQIDPIILNSINEFVDTFVTEGRLEQALNEVLAHDFPKEKVGEFVRWVVNDVKKESVAELEDSGLEWKQVSKAVSKAAQSWYTRHWS
jgi:hypothetical protein